MLDARARADIEAFGGDADALAAVVARDKVKGNAGDVVVLPFGSRILLAAGVGEDTPRDLRRAGAAIARRVKSVESVAVTAARRASAANLRALAEGLLLGGYSFKVTSAPKPDTLKTIALVVDNAAKGAVACTTQS